MPRPKVDLGNNSSMTVSPVSIHQAPEPDPESRYPSRLTALAEQGDFESIKIEAIREVAEILDIHPEEMEEPDLVSKNRGNAGGARYDGNKIVVEENPDLSSEPDWVEPADLQAEAIYEEVNHIFGHRILEQERNSSRLSDVPTFWEAAADEIVGSLYRWDEDWSFERSFEKARRDIPKIDRKTGPGISPLYHFVGYKVSEAARDSEQYSPGQIARMTNEELREEFSEEIETVRTGLADEYGIFLNMDAPVIYESTKKAREQGELDNIEEREASVYLQTGNGVYGFGIYDTKFQDPEKYDPVRKWHPFEDEVPEVAKPESYREE